MGYDTVQPYNPSPTQRPVIYTPGMNFGAGGGGGTDPFSFCDVKVNDGVPSFRMPEGVQVKAPAKSAKGEGAGGPEDSESPPPAPAEKDLGLYDAREELGNRNEKGEYKRDDNWDGGNEDYLHTGLAVFGGGAAVAAGIGLFAMANCWNPVGWCAMCILAVGAVLSFAAINKRSQRKAARKNRDRVRGMTKNEDKAGARRQKLVQFYVEKLKTHSFDSTGNCWVKRSHPIEHEDEKAECKKIHSSDLPTDVLYKQLARPVLDEKEIPDIDDEKYDEKMAAALKKAESEKRTLINGNPELQRLAKPLERRAAKRAEEVKAEEKKSEPLAAAPTGFTIKFRSPEEYENFVKVASKGTV